MNITVENTVYHFSSPATVETLLAAWQKNAPFKALGAQICGKIYALDDVITHDAALTPLTYKTEEGRRIYERSLRFVFLMAMRRIYPDTHVRIEHSLGSGVYITLDNKRLYPHDVEEIELTMRDIVKENLPFERETLTRQQAIDYFQSIGDTSKARLLSYRPYDFFNVYRCDGMMEYFYGAMLPSTGHVPLFSARAHTPGMLLFMPTAQSPNTSAPYHPSPKQMATFQESNHWCRILSCQNAADLNDFIKRNELRQFIRVNEALHDKSISNIADEIVRQNARAIYVAGPSSSGKTTFANRLCIHLRVNGLDPVLISLDDFYRNRDELPLEKDGEPDLEALSALDVPRFQACLKSLLNLKPTWMPTFSFTEKKQNPKAYQLTLSPNQPIIFEGIHALNPKLHQGFQKSNIFRIYISQLTCLNLDTHNRIRTTDARLLRRIVRDSQFRGTSPEKTLAMWDKVRAGEEKWIFPYQENCDVMFNSALHYELPVLSHLGFAMLKRIGKDDPHYLKYSRLKKILNYFSPIDDDLLNEIPPLSILREFIGGNTLYRTSHD